MAHFEVGKMVICIKTHSNASVNRGQMFELFGIKKAECKCGHLMLDVGVIHPIKADLYASRCVVCGGDSSCKKHDNTLWLHHSIFAPWDTTLSETTVEQLLEEIETVTI